MGIAAGRELVHAQRAFVAGKRPDGTSIAFVSMRDGSFDIYRMPVPVELQIGGRRIGRRVWVDDCHPDLELQQKIRNTDSGFETVQGEYGGSHGRSKSGVCPAGSAHPRFPRR